MFSSMRRRRRRRSRFGDSRPEIFSAARFKFKAEKRMVQKWRFYDSFLFFCESIRFLLSPHSDDWVSISLGCIDSHRYSTHWVSVVVCCLSSVACHPSRLWSVVCRLSDDAGKCLHQSGFHRYSIHRESVVVCCLLSAICLTTLEGFSFKLGSIDTSMILWWTYNVSPTLSLW